MPSVQEVLAVILGGGVGTRLYPLNKMRAKPAVPIAGQYRLIDVPISNCINSGISRIAVLTQFNSVSLHRHITQTYRFDDFHTGWVQIWAAEQTPRSTDWYQGTADAVRKQLFEIKASGANYVLILAGDHLYRMDYREMATFHWENQADITVAVQPVHRQDAPRFGLLKLDADRRISDFVEKPKDPETQARFISRDETERPFLGSMGIYLFNTSVLVDLLENSTSDDFGGQVVPNALPTHKVFGYDFDDYWEDIGTIRSFYEANLRLTRPDPPFNFYDPVRPIYTRTRYLPSTVIHGAELANVVIADGCKIGDADLSDSIIGLRSQISDGVKMRSTIMMGADYYETKSAGSKIPLGLGKGCEIEGAIIDKNARIGDGVVIRPFPLGTDLDEALYVVRDGIIVIPKSTLLPAGTYIGPA